MTVDRAETLTLSVVIPAFNEEDGIAGILERLLDTGNDLKSVGVDRLEVIVVDDGSSDQTGQIVEQTPGIRLIRHPLNRGYGAAIKTGFSASRGEFLAFIDADSTYPPECFVEMCRVMNREKADLVIGSRRSGTESSMPAIRKLGNLIWSCLLSLIGNKRVQDPASGMRLLRRNSLLHLYPLPDGLNFTPVMSTRALHERLKVVEIPIPYRERSGRSKLSVARDGTRFLKTILWTALEYNPARIMELVGFAALTLAGLIAAVVVGARLQGITTLGPLGVLAVFASLVMAVGGVSMFSLGISFNYLVALFHKRPIRQASLVAGLLGPSPERHFGWLGLVLGTLGIALGGVTLLLGLNGWEITRLWLWLLGSALLILVGLQLALFWMLIRVLETLNQREDRIGADLAGTPAVAEAVPAAAHPAMSASA